MVTILALLVLGGGTAYAATQLAKSSVGTKQLKKEAVTPAKLSKAAKTTLTGPAGPKGAKRAQGPKGATGARGATGAKGEPGTPATVLWAVISGTPEVIRARNVSAIETFGPGETIIKFGQNINQCSWQATLANPGEGPPPTGFIELALRSNTTDSIYVETKDAAGTKTNLPFHLAVFC